MLVNAGVRFGGGPMRTMGGAQAGSVERARCGETGALRNIHAGEATVVGGASISDRNGRPGGYLHPRSWSMPIKGGGMASRFAIAGTGTLSPTGQAGYPMTAPLDGSGSISAGLTGAYLASVSITGSGAIVVTITALGNVSGSLAGTGSITSDLAAAAGLAASIAGTGSLSSSASASVAMVSALTGAGTIGADGVGAAILASALVGAGSVTADAIGAFLAAAGLTGAGSVAVTLTAPASIAAPLTGAGALAVSLYAQGNMTAALGQDVTEVSPDAIAAAVWAHGSAVSLVAAVELIRQISDNRLEVDITGQRLVLYDDDGVTELRTWALDTDAGEDVATATGVQTKRGAGA